MYCREVAPFETPSFRKKFGQLIAHATNTPRRNVSGAPTGYFDCLMSSSILALNTSPIFSS